MEDDYYLSSEDEDHHHEEEDDEEMESDGENMENDMMAFGDEKATIAEASLAKVISRQSLLAAQKGDLHKVMEFLSLKEYHSRTLLIHYRWDVDEVIKVYVENGKEFLYNKVGVNIRNEENNNTSEASSEVVMCGICMDEIPVDNVTVMDCMHGFCNDCWTEHFIVQINEGQSRRITCMEFKCNAVCDEGVIRSLVTARDTNIAEKFERFLLESYIDDNRQVKWCPSVPHCGNAIRIEEDDLIEVECACGDQFCFRCLNEAHSPCSCRMWEKWMKTLSDGSQTVKYIAVNTKPCPKCGKPVEKNGGCNWVLCICQQPFCWLCGGATGRNHSHESIEGHSCGRFKEDKKEELEKTKKDHVRFSHYFERNQAHKASLKLEATKKKTIEAMIANCEGKLSAANDYRWIIEALDRLLWSRRIVMCSYPFAYYVFGELLKKNMTKEERGIKQNLFEDQQELLEASMEKLSKFTEEPLQEYSEEKLNDLKQRTMDVLALLDNLCQRLFECIECDLLGELQFSGQIHKLASYNTKGAEKASEVNSF